MIIPAWLIEKIKKDNEKKELEKQQIQLDIEEEAIIKEEQQNEIAETMDI